MAAANDMYPSCDPQTYIREVLNRGILLLNCVVLYFMGHGLLCRQPHAALGGWHFTECRYRRDAGAQEAMLCSNTALPIVLKP